MNNAWPETVILWGAGATKNAGLLATQDIARALTQILSHQGAYCQLDFTKLLPGITVAKQLQDGFINLLNKLQLNDMNYDIEALINIASISPKDFDAKSSKKTILNLQELFTLIDQLLDSNMGIEVLDSTGKKQFIDVHRINEARNCLKLLSEELQRIAIQGETPGKMSKAGFYHNLADTIAGLMAREAFHYEARGYKKDTRNFYLFSYAVISFNWDPLLMWALFNAHKALNDRPPYMKGCLPLRLFSDFGTTIATRKVKGSSNAIWFSASETQVIKINDSEYPSRFMRVGKLLYPHGIFGSRLCPQCGKLVMSFGHVWDKDSPLAFGPSLIKELQQDFECDGEDQGVINCPFCGQKTYPHNMPLEMQTVLKKRPIAPLEEIKKEMGLLIKYAKHIIFAGYSMPKDDISEKVFLASSLAGKRIEEKRCTIIQYDDEYKGADWLKGRDILGYLQTKGKSDVSEAISSVLSIFDLNQTRLTLKGIPGIFDCYSDMEQSVIDIFYCGDFPPERG